MNGHEARKTRLKIGIAALVLLIFSAQVSNATVEDRSTFQQWYFAESEPNYGPDTPNSGTLDNEFGTPLLYVGNRAQYLLGTMRNGWALRNDEMDIYIPNFQNNLPESYKIMEVELTWKAGTESIVPDLPKEPIVWTSPQGLPTGIINNNDVPPGWTTTTFTFRIQPNPVEEWVFTKGNILVVGVSISTECVPEPATLGLFIGGVLLAFKRRRCVK